MNTDTVSIIIAGLSFISAMGAVVFNVYQARLTAKKEAEKARLEQVRIEQQSKELDANAAEKITSAAAETVATIQKMLQVSEQERVEERKAFELRFADARRDFETKLNQLEIDNTDQFVKMKEEYHKSIKDVVVELGALKKSNDSLGENYKKLARRYNRAVEMTEMLLAGINILIRQLRENDIEPEWVPDPDKIYPLDQLEIRD